MLQPFLQPQQPPQRRLWSVSELNLQAKNCLETQLGSLWLKAEISNLTRAASGHWYFTLKDDNAQVRCALFRFKAQTLTFTPKDGDQIIAKGKVSLYEARGDYQFIVDYLEPAGEGDLQLKLRELMQKLQTEGLFESSRKKSLPYLPNCIGVITSPQGAAIHDVLTVLARRCPMVPVIIYPTQVQGAAAVNELLTALDLAESRRECDVLLLTRGGGSLEDLWCFNDERLARRITTMTLPIAAAIGHEVDVSIAELVADLRAPTPSAAAEMLVPDQIGLQQGLDQKQLQLQQAMQLRLEQMQVRIQLARLRLSDPSAAIASSQQRLQNLKQRLHFTAQRLGPLHQERLTRHVHRLNQLNPQLRLERLKQSLQRLSEKLEHTWRTRMREWQNSLSLQAASLDAMSPLSTLKRGYTITKDHVSGQLISSVSQIKPAQKIEIRFVDGTAEACIESVNLRT